MNDFQILMASPATTALLITNIVISIMAFGNVRLFDAMLFDVGRIRRNNEFHRMFTSGFVHGDPAHLFINMLSLYFLGPFVELAIGTWSFLGLYLAALIAGSLWTFMEHFRSMSYKAVGASGAISGVTTAAALIAPFATIYAFFVLPMPLGLFAILYIVWSAWASATQVRDGVGHAAHLGGALMGIVVICVFYPEAVRLAWTQLLARLPS